MAEMATTTARWPMRRWLPACCLGILLAVLGGLHVWGDQQAYLNAFAWLGVTDAAKRPFLDTHAVLSALVCHRQGIDVYVSNPCDVLHRLHAYTPFWLLASPLPVDTRATVPVGLTLGVLFILGLLTLPTARGGRELLLLVLACVSSTTLYALERGNNDLVVWLLVLAIVLGLQGSWPRRVGGYALIVFAALLKLYPMALLALAVWEKPRRFFGVWAGALAITGAIILPDLPAWRQTGAGAPTARHGIDMFGATNFPFALADGLARSGWDAPWIRPALLAACTAYAASLAVRMIARFDFFRAVGLLSHRERLLLMAGGVLLVGCFFTATNVFYRGIYFLFVLPGLFTLWRDADKEAAFVCGALAIAIPGIMWAEGLRHALGQAVLPWGGEAMRQMTDLMVWTVHELLLWWAITTLTALILALVRISPTGDWAWNWLLARRRAP